MSDVIAGVEVPDTAAVAEATQRVRDDTSPLIYHHSRRVFFFGQLHAQRLGLEPDAELLYLAAMFHDTGLMRPFSDEEQRFEVDGAGPRQGLPARARFLRCSSRHGVDGDRPAHDSGHSGSDGSGNRRHQPRVLTDVIGLGLGRLDADQLEHILAVHPRGDFKNEFLSAYFDGLKDRPNTTNGTVNSDVLEHFIPGFERTTSVQRILGSAWPS